MATRSALPLIAPLSHFHHTGKAGASPTATSRVQCGAHRATRRCPESPCRFPLPISVATLAVALHLPNGGAVHSRAGGRRRRRREHLLARARRGRTRRTEAGGALLGACTRDRGGRPRRLSKEASRNTQRTPGR